MKWIALAAIAVALSTAADLGLAAASGYALRTDWAMLLGADAVLLALVVVPALGLLGVARLVARAPRTCVILAAAAPLLLAPLWRGAGAYGPVPELVSAGVLLLALPLELRARRPPTGRAGLAAVAVSALVIALAIDLPSPGRSMLAAPESAGSEATPDAPNLLLIVLDTVRFDHLGVYGAARATPWLDRFAAQSTVFTHALSSSSWTLPAHATLFTGLFPRAHGADLIHGDGGVSLAALGRLEDIARARPLARDAVTLAELAQQARMETGAICANTAFLYRYYGLDQGFATYVDAPGSRIAARPAGLALAVAWGLRHFRRAGGQTPPVPPQPAAAPADASPPAAAPLPRRPTGIAARGRRLIESNERYYLLASEVNDLALRWLEPRRDRRFFLFLNYMDAHHPYLPIGGYRRLFPDADTPQHVDLWSIRERRRDILPAERGPMVDAYDAEIRYLDDHLAALFAQLQAWGLLERTVVVFVADHGESFGEHHEMGHGNGVYETEVRVPLLLRVPGQRTGQRVERLVHLVDVFPTLVDLLRFERPSPTQGVSLLGDGAARPVPAVVQTGRYHDLARDHPRYYDRTHDAVYRDPWKLIARSDGSTELYDVRADPAEERDVAAAEPARVDELRGDIAGFETAVQPLFATSDIGPASAETLERLKALGYVQ